MYCKIVDDDDDDDVDDDVDDDDDDDDDDDGDDGRYGSNLVEITDEVEAKDVGWMVQKDKPSWGHYWIGNVQTRKTFSNYCRRYGSCYLLVNNNNTVIIHQPNELWN